MTQTQDRPPKLVGDKKQKPKIEGGRGQTKMDVLIYGLCEPGTTLVRYIGKTAHTLQARLAGHLEDAVASPTESQNRRIWWLRRLIAGGQTPAIMLLDIGGERTWAQLERFHIQAHRIAGFDLLNASRGGEAGGRRRVRPRRSGSGLRMQHGPRSSSPVAMCAYCGKRVSDAGDANVAYDMDDPLGSFDVVHKACTWAYDGQDDNCCKAMDEMCHWLVFLERNLGFTEQVRRMAGTTVRRLAAFGFVTGEGVPLESENEET